MHHTMIVVAPARIVTTRWPAVAVKSDVKTGHDIAYLSRGHASGCARAMAYYTRSGESPGTWEGRGCAALGVSGTLQAEVAERLYQEGIGPSRERIIRHADPKSDEDQHLEVEDRQSVQAGVAGNHGCAPSHPQTVEAQGRPHRLLPILLPSRWTTPVPDGQLRNVGPAHGPQWTILDDVPTTTDQRAGGSSPSERVRSMRRKMAGSSRCGGISFAVHG